MNEPCDDPIVEAVVASLRARSAAGLKKYGTPLTRDDLSRSQWLQHAQEEALDLANYLERIQGNEEMFKDAVSDLCRAWIESMNAGKGRYLAKPIEHLANLVGVKADFNPTLSGEGVRRW